MKIKKIYTKVKKAIFENEVAKNTIKNSSWLITDKVFSMVIAILVTAIVARYFGPENYGQFNYAMAFSTLFIILSGLGLDTLAIKSIIDKDYDEGTILCTSFFLRIFGGILIIIISFTIIRLIEPGDHNLQLLVLVLSSTMVFKAFEVIEYWINAYQKAKISSIIHISAYIATAILKLLLVFFKGNLFHYALIYLADSFIVGTALVITYFKKREIIYKWRFSFNYAKNILLKSWYLILSGLMITLYMRVDQLMLGSMMPTKIELGLYSAAAQIAGLWYFIPEAIITSFKPLIMNSKNTDKGSYKRLMQLLYTIIAWVGIGFNVLILLFSKLIINILYGAAFLKSASILAVSIWSGTFAMLGSALSVWLICEGLQRYTIIFMGAGFLLNVLLNYLLIPISGGYGAAIATLSSQIVVNFIVPSFFKDTRTSSTMIMKAFKFEGVFK